MENDLVSRTIQCVEVLYSPTSTNVQKNEASCFLNYLSNSEQAQMVAITIMSSQNESCSESGDSCVDVTLNSRFFAANLLMKTVETWKSVPNQSQTNLIHFMESYLVSNISVSIDISQ